MYPSSRWRNSPATRCASRCSQARTITSSAPIWCMAMQALGNKASYVRLTSTGPSALDFHIACYLGRILAQEPSARCTVISKDKGFDALIAFLKGEGHAVERSASIDAMPELSGIPLAKKRVQRLPRQMPRRARRHLPLPDRPRRGQSPKPRRSAPCPRAAVVEFPPPPRPSMPILTLLSRTSLSAGRPCLPR